MRMADLARLAIQVFGGVPHSRIPSLRGNEIT